MIFTATLTDKFGRRPLTVYPYAVTVIAEFCLGILGCFNYKEQALSSLLVSLRSSSCIKPALNHLLGILRLPSHILHHRCFSYWLRLRCRGTSTASTSKDCGMGTCNLEHDRYLVQFHHAADDQWFCQVGCKDRIFVSVQPASANFLTANIQTALAAQEQSLS